MLVNVFILILTSSIFVLWIQSFSRGNSSRCKVFPDYILHSTPFVSIIIPAWNEASVIKCTLEALNRIKYPEWEALVVAGGNDGTEELAKRITQNWENFHVIQQFPLGKNAAINCGLDIARGEVIVILDADCIVENNWLIKLVAPLTNGYEASFANYEPQKHTFISEFFMMKKVLDYYINKSTVLHGGGVALSRRVINEIGSFPENVNVGVDWDLDVRLSKINVKKAFAQRASHSTQLPSSMPQFLRDEIRWRRAHIRSIVRFSEKSFNGMWAVLASTRLYATSVIFFLSPLVGVLFAKQTSMLSIKIWIFIWLWILLRSATIAIAVFGYSRDYRWLYQIWVPPLLLIISFIGGLVAIMTIRNNNKFFKGPRPV